MKLFDLGCFRGPWGDPSGLGGMAIGTASANSAKFRGIRRLILFSNRAGFSRMGVMGCFI